VKTKNYELYLKLHALIQIPGAQIRKLDAQKYGNFLSRLRNLQTFQSGRVFSTSGTALSFCLKLRKKVTKGTILGYTREQVPLCNQLILRTN
jgi:hypothetical protein